jgi:hypothetical protein
MVALRRHFFFVPVYSQLSLPQNGLPTVPVILVADSIAPLNVTTKVVCPQKSVKMMAPIGSDVVWRLHLYQAFHSAIQTSH